ncbi:MAG: hypothetical protein EBT17_05480 [Actinobacteria bacterium]|nr:hypothetical protein [Actinomycetota bacterium]
MELLLLELDHTPLLLELVVLELVLHLMFLVLVVLILLPLLRLVLDTALETQLLLLEQILVALRQPTIFQLLFQQPQLLPRHSLLLPQLELELLHISGKFKQLLQQLSGQILSVLHLLHLLLLVSQLQITVRSTESRLVVPLVVRKLFPIQQHSLLLLLDDV